VKTRVLPFLIACFYWFWSHLWRLRVVEDPELTKIKNSQRVIFAHWHGDELVVIRLGPVYHCAAITSTSKDGELMNNVLHYLGFGTSRGSSTRGGARALIGMMQLMKSGFHATMAIDGPKGPRHKPKPGTWALSKHTGAPVIPMGVARKSAFIFKRSWNKTYLPWPFTKVVVSFGAPMIAEHLTEEEFSQRLEKQMHLQRGLAQKLLSLFFIFSLGFALASCSTEEKPATAHKVTSTEPESLLERTIHQPLKPRGKIITGKEPAIIKYILPGSAAEKLGFKIGDQVLKLNGKPVDSFLEFEKKIKNIPVLTEIEYKTKGGKISSKQLHMNNALFGARTAPQNIALIKPASESLVYENKGPLTVFCSVSKTEDQSALFVNFIADSIVQKPASSAQFTIKSKKPGLLIKGSEPVDALGANSVFISKKIPLNKKIDGGLVILLSLGGQQFTFEFQE
jgi:lysophospholipid acyltransferase (LPLAT)-like uncharacterized protein